MSNNYELPEEKNKLLSKVKKGQKIYQNEVNDIIKTNYLNKFVNAKEKRDNNNNINKDKKDNLNYSVKNHKRVKSNCKNNLNNSNNSIEHKGHYKTRSDLIYYDYLLSVCKEIKNNDDNNYIINSNPKNYMRYASMDNSLQSTIKEEY